MLNTEKYLFPEKFSNNSKEIVTKEDLYRALESKKEFIGFAKFSNMDGDLKIELPGGITGVLLRRDFSSVVGTNGKPHLTAIKKFVGKKLKVRVSKYNGNSLIFDRASIIKEERSIYANNLSKGDTIKGVVAGIIESGALIDIGADITAILPKSKIERVYVTDINNHLQIGEVIEAKIDEIKIENDDITKISLDRACIRPTFSEAAKDLEVGCVVLARATKISETGIFCIIDGSISALCNFGKVKLNVPCDITMQITKINNHESRIIGDLVSVIRD